MRCVAKLALLLAIAACGHAAEPNPSILNGKDAPKGRFDYVAQLRFPYNDDLAWLPKGAYACVGTLVAPDVVLTSTECALLAGGFPKVRLGSYKREESPGHYQARTVTAALLGTGERKVSPVLLKLDRPSGYPYPKLAAAVPRLNARLTIAGWGATSMDNEEQGIMAHNLKTATMEYKTPRICTKEWNNDDLYWSGEQFCARFSGHKKSGCEGDNGGPIIRMGASASKDVLVGYEKHTDCMPYGGIYGSVFSDKAWIEEGIRVLHGARPTNPKQFWLLEPEDPEPNCQVTGRPCASPLDCCVKDSICVGVNGLVSDPEGGLGLCLPPTMPGFIDF